MLTTLLSGILYSGAVFCEKFGISSGVTSREQPLSQHSCKVIPDQTTLYSSLGISSLVFLKDF